MFTINLITMGKCKYQFIKKDKDDLFIYKCKLNTELCDEAFRIKRQFEEQFPEKTFCLTSGVCYYIGYEHDCPLNE